MCFGIAQIVNCIQHDRAVCLVQSGCAVLMVILTQKSGAGNHRSCNLISRVEDVINMEEM